MDGNGVGEIKFGYLVAVVFDPSLVREKGNRQAEVDVVDGSNQADIAIEHVQFVIVAAMNDPVTGTKNAFTDGKFCSGPIRWIDALLQHVLRFAAPSDPRIIGVNT